MAIRTSNGKKVNGIVFDKLSNGQMEYESNWKDGVLDGIKKYWFENGQLQYERSVKNGKQDGLERTWHFNGRLISEANFTEGNLISKKCWGE